MTQKIAKKAAPKKAPAPYVVVRTCSAGVHVGLLVKREGAEVTLTDARRVWRWYGANTLHEVSLRGVDVSRSRLSDPVPSILVLGAIEVLPCSTVAESSLRGAKWTA